MDKRIKLLFLNIAFCVSWFLRTTYFHIFGERFVCGFRKGYDAQQCLLLMLGMWKEAKDNNKAFGTLLTDLSKAFDCLSHDLLIAKLIRIASYMGTRKRRTLKSAFFKSQFNYDPLIWMCCNRSLNNSLFSPNSL